MEANLSRYDLSVSEMQFLCLKKPKPTKQGKILKIIIIIIKSEKPEHIR